jgi:hypothetical protein
MVIRSIITRRTKEQRKQDRKGVSLKKIVLAPVTMKRYNAALQHFFEWKRRERIPLPKSVMSLDDSMGEWIDVCYQEGEHKGLCGDGVSAMQHYLPSVRRHLNGAWRLLRAWAKHELPAQAAPFNYALVCALSSLAWDVGLRGFSVIFMFGFLKFCRSGELFDLTKRNLQVSGAQIIAELVHTKKGMRDAVSCESATLAARMQQVLDQLEEHDCILGMTGARARQILKFLLEFLHVDAGIFRWYSLRRGGATRFFRITGSMERTLVLGRWERSKTARIYLTQAMADLSEVRQQTQGKALVAHFARRWKC